jgi:hypothetical protein
LPLSPVALSIERLDVSKVVPGQYYLSENTATCWLRFVKEQAISPTALFQLVQIQVQ